MCRSGIFSILLLLVLETNGTTTHNECLINEESLDIVRFGYPDLNPLPFNLCSADMVIMLD